MTKTILIKTIKDIKSIISQCKRPLGLVPTMGALHAGHISLIKKARNECETLIIYIFVNPLQFTPEEDFSEYPKDLNADLKICEDNNANILFAPSENEIYPDNNYEIIKSPENLSSILCGKTRKNHFSGVATVLNIFFKIIEPDIVYFGEKDLQQLYVVRWLINEKSKEYKFPILIKGCQIVREATGLACSSRNRYLSEELRNISAALYKSLQLAKQNSHSGIFPVSKSILESLIFLSHFNEIKVEYFEARDKEALKLVNEQRTRDFYYLIAARVGNVRLIDNIEV